MSRRYAMRRLTPGTTVVLNNNNNISRRKFLSLLGSVGAGIPGLKKAIEESYDAKITGKPLVYTVDKFGNPDIVRIIEDERYQRLLTYYELPVQKYISRFSNLNGVSLVQNDGLMLNFYVENNSWRTRKRLPNRIRGTPIAVEERSGEMIPEASTAVGGQTIANNSGSAGTMAVACYDESSDDPVAIASDHHMDGEENMFINAEIVADFHKRDKSNDVTSYKIRDGVDTNIRGTISIPDIEDAWTFSGLSDAVSGDKTLLVQFFGAASDKVDDTCFDTERNDRVKYQANMVQGKTSKGDSGGPWVDENYNRLVGVHYGRKNGEHSVCSVGQEALDAVDAVLYKGACGEDDTGC